MSSQALVELLHNILSGHHDPVAAIVQSEQERGFTVVRPGEAPWLPLADWRPASVCSIHGDEARLVLLHAFRPGGGALTRTLAQLAMCRLRPAVVDPTPELAAALQRRGWRGRAVGRTFETRETVWRPVAETAQALPDEIAREIQQKEKDA